MDIEEIVKLNIHKDDFVIVKAPRDRWDEIRAACRQLQFQYTIPVLFMQSDEDLSRVGNARAKEILKDLKAQAEDLWDI